MACTTDKASSGSEGFNVGSKIDGSMKVFQLVNGKPTAVTAESIFLGKRTVLFGVPGAFTPTCSTQHLPGFIELSDQIKAAGADQIICVSVNDAFVMDAWGKATGATGKVDMLGDGGELAESMKMLSDRSAVGMGKRSMRYALILNREMAVEMFAIDPSGTFGETAAPKILEFLSARPAAA